MKRKRDRDKYKERRYKNIQADENREQARKDNGNKARNVRDWREKIREGLREREAGRLRQR